MAHLRTVTLAALACLAAGSARAASGTSLLSAALPDAEIIATQTVTGGTFTPPGGTAITGLPTFCRAVGHAHPVPGSNIGFEVWLPATWNGRFQGVGNGGLAGGIVYGALAQAIQQGYAAASTDDGHAGSDPTWLGNHTQLVDFGTRAVHVTAQLGQRITRDFYGARPQKSYFVGCSEGGREALMEAQRFPDDYDGIIAGDAFNDATATIVGQLYISATMLASPEAGLDLTALGLLHDTVLGACDGIDAVSDGVLTDPRQCRFKPKQLLCAPGETSCLSAAQVDTATRLYQGARNPRTGRQIFPGQVRGSESLGGVIGWYIFQLGIPLQSFSLQILPYAVFHDPNWDYTTFNYDTDTALVNRTLGPIWNATSPDLDAFAARGGKLIQYHGFADWLITPKVSLDYRAHVVARAGDPSDYYRLFMAPGVGHCSGGPGPNAFGMPGQPTVTNDASHSLIAALDRWVSDGIAPRRVIATKFVNDDPAQGVQTTRPLCVFPQVATYKGVGSTDQASSFACAQGQ